VTFADHKAQQDAFREGLAQRHQSPDDAIGNAEVAADEVRDMGDVYDHEMIAIKKVSAEIRQHIGKPMEGSAFQRMVREKFAAIGFVVRCDLKKDMLDPKPWDEKPWIPSVEFLGRTDEQGEFDHDQMGHEVRSNILGEKGRDSVQKTHVAPGWAQSSSGLITPN
jgi:hypothetical protein